MTALDEFRAAKDQFFGTDQQSPLLPEQRAAFDGLRYYAENPALALEATPEP